MSGWNQLQRWDETGFMYPSFCSRTLRPRPREIPPPRSLIDLGNGHHFLGATFVDVWIHGDGPELPQARADVTESDRDPLDRPRPHPVGGGMMDPATSVMEQGHRQSVLHPRRGTNRNVGESMREIACRRHRVRDSSLQRGEEEEAGTRNRNPKPPNAHASGVMERKQMAGLG